MLVVLMKAGQKIQIGENVRVVLVETRGGQARLAVEAPSDVAIRRKDRLARGDTPT